MNNLGQTQLWIPLIPSKPRKFMLDMSFRTPWGVYSATNRVVQLYKKIIKFHLILKFKIKNFAKLNENTKFMQIFWHFFILSNIQKYLIKVKDENFEEGWLTTILELIQFEKK